MAIPETLPHGIDALFRVRHTAADKDPELLRYRADL
jgi:hypothetical protein